MTAFAWDPATLWALFGHMLLLSLLSIGGAITVAPDMHRWMVVEHHLLTDPQFASSIAIAQAAPATRTQQSALIVIPRVNSLLPLRTPYRPVVSIGKN